MKIIDILALSRQELKNAHINSYQIDALILLSHYLNLSKEQIIFDHNLSLDQRKSDEFFSLIKRRASKEPVSHIIGKREFFGNNFIINHSVLDPRPDSETLIEVIINYFADKNSQLEILELGTGSGCLILTILKIFINSFGIAIDVSQDALNIAAQNADLLSLQNHCRFLHSNWFEKINAQQKFDLIISNPPYIVRSEINNLQEEVKNYEPITALDGGVDGLECYRQIAKNIVNFLKPQAILVLEIGKDQENSVTEIFAIIGLKLINIKKDLAGINRCLMFQIN